MSWISRSCTLKRDRKYKGYDNGFDSRRGDSKMGMRRFDFDGMVLPDDGEYRLKVYPRNSLGVAGLPLATQVFAPKPGKDKLLGKKG